MRRRTLLAIFTATVLLLAGALLVVQRSSSASLSPAELASKHIHPPSSWADPDCGRLRRAITAAAGATGRNAAINAGPLSADEVAVYRAVLHQWNSDARTLNLANRTLPLNAISSESSCECRNDMDVENLVIASHSFHSLTQDSFPEKTIRLVGRDKQFATIRANDPQNGMAAGKSVAKAVKDAFQSGLFSLSEIAFDRDHRHALVSYGFVCGSLCGSGGTWLLEKVDGVWKRTRRDCGGWIS